MLIIFIHVSSTYLTYTTQINIAYEMEFFHKFSPKLLITNDVKGDVDSSNAPPPNKRSPLLANQTERMVEINCTKRHIQNAIWPNRGKKAREGRPNSPSPEEKDGLTNDNGSVYPESRSYQPASPLLHFSARKSQKKATSLSIDITSSAHGGRLMMEKQHRGQINLPNLALFFLPLISSSVKIKRNKGTKSDRR